MIAQTLAAHQIHEPRHSGLARLTRVVGVVALSMFVFSAALAHEPTQTHRRLTIAAFELFKKDNPQYDFLAVDGIAPIDVELELAVGQMEEDRCLGQDDFGTNWQEIAPFWSHFYDPATRRNTIPIPPMFGACDQDATEAAQQHAPGRAREIWQMAVQAYRSGNKRAAFRYLGRVLHLSQDMTSPAHVHNDPHGHLIEIRWSDGDEGTDLGGCSLDIDDFEQWGFCQRPSPKTQRILDYYRYTTETGDTSLIQKEDMNSWVDCEGLFITDCTEPAATTAAYKRDYKKPKTLSTCGDSPPPPGYTCRLWEAVERLYEGEPQTVADPQLDVRGRRLATTQQLRSRVEGSQRTEARRGLLDERPPENPGQTYIRRMAEITYDFTTFHVKLKDTDAFSADIQPDSELNRMLRPAISGNDDCSGLENYGLCDDLGDFEIFGDQQWIGRTEGECGSRDFLDITEEWWVMPRNCDRPSPFACNRRRDIECSVPGIPCDVRDDDLLAGVCTGEDNDDYRTPCTAGKIPSDCPGFSNTCSTDFGLCVPVGITVDGYAYIENVGGEGQTGTRERDSFVPLKYGCDPGEFCGAAANWQGAESESGKAMFKKLYGKHQNDVDDVLPCPGATDSNDPCAVPQEKTMLRIYGDVLYPTAIAYGAGLIEAFMAEVHETNADAGGPYMGEACQPVQLDGSGSSAGEGEIVLYEWDFTGDGVFDETSTSPLTEHSYPEPFSGNLTLRVTGNQGVQDEDLAAVNITEDMTGPEIMIPASVTAECEDPSGTPIMLGEAGAEDACCEVTDLSNNAPDLFPLGETLVEWTATDCGGNMSTATQTVNVVDTAPPSIEVTLRLVRSIPPLGLALFNVEVETADTCGGSASVVLTDIVGGPYERAELETEDYEFLLESGTLYEITYTATDESGNSATESVRVRPPGFPRRLPGRR